jgi:MFS transporter, MCT family, solute carrier family 16 (monocarboxylic acid transporters), member 10
MILTSCTVNEHTPLVYAIVTAGSAVGGVIYPIMFQQLEPRIGSVDMYPIDQLDKLDLSLISFKWTMRVFGFFQLFFFVFGVAVGKI